MKNMIPKKGKVLVVIGGCGGIGKSVVHAGLENQLNVVVFDLEKVIMANPLPNEVLTVAVDATKEEELIAAFTEVKTTFSGIDYLVNLVGFISSFEPVASFKQEDWEYMLNGNLNSCLLACKTAIPLLKPGGAIVNMSSGLALVGQKGYSAYSTSKAGIIAITKTLAAELAPDIRVNCVAPGAVNTAFLSGGLAHGGEEGQGAKRVDMEAYIKRVPLGRIAEPEDITGPILFLLSESARYITGQTIHINGGALMI